MIEPLTPSQLDAAERLVDEVLGSRFQARLDAVIDVLDGPGVGAWLDGELIGLATWRSDGDGAELTALGVIDRLRGRGIGAALVDAAVAALRGEGARRVWLVTTNDNTTALALYQRLGFRLVELRVGAVDRARRQKPSIPLVGRHDIPMRDELVLELPAETEPGPG